MFTLEVAQGGSLLWASGMIAAHHYLHKQPDQRSCPFAYVVRVGDWCAGCVFFGRPQAATCYQGVLTYGSTSDVVAGRAAFDRWEVLSLSRLYLVPAVQSGGMLCKPGIVPGYLDRKGRFRSCLASAVLRSALAQIGYDYLIAHPPCFLGEPYEIRAVLSYCDTRLHRGTVYRAAGFCLARTNKVGIETWWSGAVSRLTGPQNQAIRELASWHPRSVRIRNHHRTLFDDKGA